VFENTKGVIRIRISKKNIQEQWPKEKVQKDKQRSTKHIYKAKSDSPQFHNEQLPRTLDH
jgi:hypothetical protein